MRNQSVNRIPDWAVCVATTTFLVAIAAWTSGGSRSFCELPISELGQSLANKYQIKISLRFRPDSGGSDHKPIVACSLNLADSEVVLRLLESELALYPRDFIRRVILKQVVICADLIQDGQEKAAISDFTHDILYLNYDPVEENPEIKRRDIHHEIFHMIDAREDGRFEDETWSGLNSPSFRYGNGHGRKWIDMPGFLSGYATLDAAEDKAELFSYMMTAYHSVQSRANVDAVIRRKLAALKTIAANECPEMDASFWVRVPCRNRFDKAEMNSLVRKR